jgi:REP element-mobilizing transposase RayT
MAIGVDTHYTRRHLPHLSKCGKTYFVTFTTLHRAILSNVARDIALERCVYDHRLAYWLHTATIMPDHVHVILTPYEEWSLSTILKRLKGISSRFINASERTYGSRWQDESFDRIIRAAEDLREKCDYVANNPVRAGLVERIEDYKWVWRQWVDDRENDGRTDKSVCPPQ